MIYLYIYLTGLILSVLYCLLIEWVIKDNDSSSAKYIKDNGNILWIISLVPIFNFFTAIALIMSFFPSIFKDDEE
tara:strand:+ start:663 stop:887 length:225 start_codon:yes stop_codon:yes gene_type:complete